jgi:hypothetical protein
MWLRVVRHVGFETPFSQWLQDRKNAKLIAHRFDEAGYVRVPNLEAKDQQWIVAKKRQRIYGRRELSLNKQVEAARVLVNPGRR